jgi:hypothetical protein
MDFAEEIKLFLQQHLITVPSSSSTLFHPTINPSKLFETGNFHVLIFHTVGEKKF